MLELIYFVQEMLLFIGYSTNEMCSHIQGSLFLIGASVKPTSSHQNSQC